jgi:hypothetical protein
MDDQQKDFEKRRLDHERAKAAAERVAANHYRILLGDAFFRRLHNTWTAL